MHGLDIEYKIIEMLPVGIKEHTKEVSLSYENYIGIMCNHMKTLFGEAGDWKKNLERYRNSNEFINSCRVISDIDSVPEIFIDSVYDMINEEKRHAELVEELLEISSWLDNYSEKNASSEEYTINLINAAIVAGIWPSDNKDTINRFMVSRMKWDESEVISKLKDSQTGGILGLLINMMSSTYIGGLLRGYPDVDVVMVQPRTRYYYRGENAFYGKSNPSACRHRNILLPHHVVLAIEDLKSLEARDFFLNFDVASAWDYSTFNYYALGQHYGLWTTLMDITSDIKTALFFACCQYDNGKWRPLYKSEFEEKDSRSYISDDGGDSRYAILYRTPTELTEMEYGTRDNAKGSDIITPVGYQPFMRCAAQSAYILPCSDKDYDMYKDTLFEKYKIRLTEEMCQWIFCEMDKGNKIYPRNDVPDISKVIERINNTHHFSERSYNDLCNIVGWSEEQATNMKELLKSYGYHIYDKKKDYVNANKMRKWNKRYSLEYVHSLIDETPKIKPVIVI